MSVVTLEKKLEMCQKQREERGFDDVEVESLDVSVSGFLAPRLRVLAEMPSMVINKESLGKIAEFFEKYTKEGFCTPELESDWRLEIGPLFQEYFPYMWC